MLSVAECTFTESNSWSVRLSNASIHILKVTVGQLGLALPVYSHLKQQLVS
jgi:hypothetical protein